MPIIQAPALFFIGIDYIEILILRIDKLFLNVLSTFENNMNKMNKTHWLFNMSLSVLVIILAACTDSTSNQDLELRDTPQWERFQCARNLYHENEPESALAIIDSLLYDDNYIVSALSDYDNEIFLVHICQLRTKIMAFTNNMPELEIWSQKTAQICQSIKNPDDGIKCVHAEMDCNLGLALINAGKDLEGMELMEQAINSLNESNSWECKQAQISFMHKLASQFINVEYGNRLDSLSKLALSKLNAMSSQNSNIKGITSNYDLLSFVDFYTGKFLAWRAHAFLNRSQTAISVVQAAALRDSAKACVNRALKTDWGKTADADYLLFDVYPYIGMYQEFYKSSQIMIESMGVDSINNMYVEVLRCKAYIQEQQGNLNGALSLQRQIAAISNKLYQRNLRSQMAQTVEAHQLDNERQKHLETRIRLQLTILISLILFLLLAGIVILFMHKLIKSKQQSEQFRAIIAQYESDDILDNSNSPCSPQQKDKAQDTACDNMEEESGEDQNNAVKYAPLDEQAQAMLFSEIMAVMKEKQPYRNYFFDVNTLASLVNSNRSYVSYTINRTYGKNFCAWLSDYRNEIIIRAIRNNPNMSVNDLCELSGYNSKETFSRKFRQLNGMTLTEFKQLLQSSLS